MSTVPYLPIAQSQRSSLAKCYGQLSRWEHNRAVPCLAGVCATDPFRIVSQFLKQVREAGFAGVQNFPTVGLVDGVFRQGLEETGMGYDREVDMIAQARGMELH